MYDIAGAVKAVAELLTEGLKKFVKLTNEKIQDDRYKAEQNFKDFMKEVKDEEKLSDDDGSEY